LSEVVVIDAGFEKRGVVCGGDRSGDRSIVCDEHEGGWGGEL